jgi:hypothetical protein
MPSTLALVAQAPHVNGAEPKFQNCFKMPELTKYYMVYVESTGIASDRNRDYPGNLLRKRPGPLGNQATIRALGALQS